MTDKVEHSDLSDFTPDDIDANEGSVRGTAMLERSLEQYGAGRSILIDKHGAVIAGNKTLESAVGIGLKRAIVVHTTGNELVVVQRDDLDLKEGTRAIELAVADNRVGEVNLTWAVKMLSELENRGAKLEPFFTPKETDDLMQKALAYKPENAPLIATGQVTDGDIQKAADGTRSKFSGNNGPDLIDTRCPECGHAFHVKSPAK
jgi:hypothetical protein